MTKGSALIMSAALILAACAGPGIARRADDQDGLERVIESAGPPVDSVPYLLQYAGWRALPPDKVVVWANSEVGYLLRVEQPCEGLQSADQIRLTTRNAVVRPGADSIKLAGRQCRIVEIRDLDFRGLKR